MDSPLTTTATDNKPNPFEKIASAIETLSTRTIFLAATLTMCVVSTWGMHIRTMTPEPMSPVLDSTPEPNMIYTPEFQKRRDDPADNNHPSVLLLVTTHMSRAHFESLKHCWWGLIANSTLLQSADVVVASTAPPSIHPGALQWFAADVFGGTAGVRVMHLGEAGHQDGSMLAMRRAEEGKWFEDYDWVIRVNPDVLIKNDTWLLQTMRDDTVDAILSYCRLGRDQRRKPAIMTDFTIFRPRAIKPGSYSNTTSYKYAELQANAAFMDVVDAKRHRSIPHTSRNLACRINSPSVFHSHDTVDYCKQELEAPKAVTRWEWAQLAGDQKPSVLLAHPPN